MLPSLSSTKLTRFAFQSVTQNNLGLARQAALPERFRLCEVLEGIIILLDHKLQDKGIRVQKRCSPDGLELVAIAWEIRQLLWNLLTNAVEAVPSSGGRIEVRASKVPSRNDAGNARVRITVAVNRPGVERAVLQHMLEPFYTTKTNGTGLGLWVSNEITKKHAGFLKIPSSTNPGRHGTVFSVIIPDYLAGRPIAAGFGSDPDRVAEPKSTSLAT